MSFKYLYKKNIIYNLKTFNTFWENILVNDDFGEKIGFWVLRERKFVQFIYFCVRRRLKN